MCGQLHQNHLDKQLKKGEFSNSWKKNLTVTSIPYLQFHLLHAPTYKSGGETPWYFNLLYKFKKSVCCKKMWRGRSSPPVIQTPDATCLCCLQSTVCSVVFAWSQRTRPLIGPQKLWMKHYGAKSCFTIHTTAAVWMNSSIGRDPWGGGQMNFFWHLFCNRYIHVNNLLDRMFWKNSIEFTNTLD